MNFWVTVKKLNERGKKKNAKCKIRALLGKISCTPT